MSSSGSAVASASVSISSQPESSAVVDYSTIDVGIRDSFKRQRRDAISDSDSGSSKTAKKGKKGGRKGKAKGKGKASKKAKKGGKRKGKAKANGDEAGTSATSTVGNIVDTRAAVQERAAEVEIKAALKVNRERIWHKIGVVLVVIIAAAAVALAVVAIFLHLGVFDDGGVCPADTLVVSEEIRAVDGALEITLAVSRSWVLISGNDTVYTPVINGMRPGPVLRASPGDRLVITLRNDLEALSPSDRMIADGIASGARPPLNEPWGDNILGLYVGGLVTNAALFDPLIQVKPSQERVYTIDLEDHHTGVFIYQMRHHGSAFAAAQEGVHGLLIVDDNDEGLAAVDEFEFFATRLLLFSSVIRVKDSSLHYVVNGEIGPVLTMGPNERQVWRLANGFGSDHLSLTFPPEFFVGVVAVDGVVLGEPITEADTVSMLLRMPPGRRLDLVVSGTDEGVYPIETTTRNGSTVVFTVHLCGPTIPEQDFVVSSLPESEADWFRDFDPLSTEPRSIVFSTGGVGSGANLTAGINATIDGESFDGTTVAFTVAAGDEEEWVLSADDDQVYAVTLQATPMLWTEQSGVPLTPPIWVDTVTFGGGETATVRVRASPPFGGSLPQVVYLRAQQLDLEDAGMIAMIQFN